MVKHRFVDVRTAPARELWLEQSSGGYFKFQQGRYSEKVLKLLGILRSPNVERFAPPQPQLHFGRPDQVQINDRAPDRYQLKRYPRKQDHV